FALNFLSSGITRQAPGKETALPTVGGQQRFADRTQKGQASKENTGEQLCFKGHRQEILAYTLERPRVVSFLKKSEDYGRETAFLWDEIQPVRLDGGLVLLCDLKYDGTDLMVCIETAEETSRWFKHEERGPCPQNPTSPSSYLPLSTLGFPVRILFPGYQSAFSRLPKMTAMPRAHLQAKSLHTW
ncbi:hypothetical protein STEG23_031135, partial [Scotinomys teguina]